MRLRHARQHLELHQLSSGPGPKLLLLHQQFASSNEWRSMAAACDGAVFALDFPGHGQSDWLPGGAYCPEYLVASADIALQQIGPAAVAGAGLGAYVATLLAGGRPDLIPAALLLPGAGLAGAGANPDYTQALPDFAALTSAGINGNDPLVACLDTFLRPTEYVQRFAAAARCLLLAEDDGIRPPWWEEVRKSPKAESVRGSTKDLLRTLATRQAP